MPASALLEKKKCPPGPRESRGRRITASRPVGHISVWLAHLQLIYHLDFINNRKHVKKFILDHFLIIFPKNPDN